MTPDVRLLDVNVLLALADDGHPHFDPAHRWFGALSPSSRWATCPITEASYHRLMMNPAVTGRSLDSAAVLAALVGSKQVTGFHLVNLAAASNAGAGDLRPSPP